MPAENMHDLENGVRALFSKKNLGNVGENIGFNNEHNIKMVREVSAEETNKWWKEVMNYDNPPYKPGTTVQEIELSQKTTFVRVYDGDNSGL